ncbi:MAG: hypothetical protein WKF87_04735 [Chryseolinea sp.]
MKKWIFGFAIVAIISILIYRAFTEHVNGVETERTWFLQELNYDFSAVVDTVHRPNHLLFHVTHGSLDRTAEEEVGKRLKYWGQLTLLTYYGDQFELMNGSAKYKKGDSLYLNSRENITRIYRNGKLIKEFELTRALRGRPF